MKHFELPGIGMRMVKTSIAVFFSLLVSGLRPGGIATFSATAAIICMQASNSTSVKNGINRIVGTLVGAAYGLLALFITGHVPFLAGTVARAALAACFILPVIYTTVLTKQPDSAAITSIVFLSVLYATEAASPFFFALNRTADTLIGIVIAIAVNAAWLRPHRNANALFVSTYDGVLAAPDGRLSNYTTVNLNRLIERGAAITLASHRTPATLLPRVEEVAFQLPFIIMNGAAVYHVAERSFPFYVPMDSRAALALANAADSEAAQCHVYTIEHGELHVYCAAPRNTYEEDLHRSLRTRQQQSYVQGSAPPDAEILCLFVAAGKAHIDQLEATLRQMPEASAAAIINTDSIYTPGRANLEIYSVNAGKEVAVKWLQQQGGFTRLVAFGGDCTDLPMLQSADEGYLVGDGDDETQSAGLRSIGSNARDVVAKAIHRLYYQK